MCSGKGYRPMVMLALGLLVPPALAMYVLVVALVLDMDRTYAQYALVVPVAYVLGSIPWGFLIAMGVRGVDIRQYGSGRTGTSNVLRSAGGKLAIVALALDLSKGILAVLLAKAVADDAAVEVVAGLLALVGHNWPVFLKFKGGRGIATGLGGLIVMEPIAGVIAMASFSSVTFLSRYLSLGSIASLFGAFISTLALVILDLSSGMYLLYTGIGGVVILWQHHDNIQRLLQGTERRLGQAAQKIGEATGSGQTGI